MKQFAIILIFFAAFAHIANAQCDANHVIYNNLQAHLEGTPKTDINAVIVKTAQYFLETPYIGHTLDSNNVEQLVVNLNRFDCMTFVETVLALSKNYVSNNPSYQNFENILQNIRYRGGVINGYTSRLHYTSDWIYDNVRKHNVLDRTSTIGGVPFCPILNFMSTHSQNYLQLKNSPADVDTMRVIEGRINARKSLYYIKKAQVNTIEKSIDAGNLIMITTSVAGLDYGHVGFAINDNGVLKFIHASSDKKKVVKTASSLSAYLLNVKSFTGISVLKAN